MAHRTDGLETTIWTDAAKTDMLAAVLDRMGNAVKPTAVGGPRCAEVDALARRLGCEAHDDLRKMLVERPAACVVFGSVAKAKAADIGAALSQGACLLAFEPVASNFDELGRHASASRSAASGYTIHCPGAFLRGPGWSQGAQMLESLGRLRLIQFVSTGPAAERSVYARLDEAWQLVLHLGQVPESVDASLVGPSGEVPENLRETTGHMAIHARLPHDAVASLVLSDAVGSSSRHLMLVADGGTLSVCDSGCELLGPDGRRSSSPPQAAAERAFVDQVADDWRVQLGRSGQAFEVLADPREVLACCLASQLSARTRESESPATMLKLGGPR